MNDPAASGRGRLLFAVLSQHILRPSLQGFLNLHKFYFLAISLALLAVFSNELGEQLLALLFQTTVVMCLNFIEISKLQKKYKFHIAMATLVSQTKCRVFGCNEKSTLSPDS